MFNTVLFIAFALLTSSSSAQVEILSKGSIKKPLNMDTTVVIKNQEDLSQAWNSLGIEAPTPPVDFSNELVIAIVPDHKIASGINIVDIGKIDANINVVYYVIPPTANLKSMKGFVYPFLVFKLSQLDPAKAKITFQELAANVPTNTGMGKHVEYTNVLEQYDLLHFRNYFPLDKGNSWTYQIDSPKGLREETFAILSISQEGWSNFDRFFGKNNVAFKSFRDNTLMVLDDNKGRPFYTPNIQSTFNTTEYRTPAGTFTDTMEITVPKGANFWFRDVYAKNVGLILHEHQRGGQTVKYTLIKAHVRGTPYPQTSETPVNQIN